MLSNSKFFGIIDFHEFVKLPLIDKKLLLIEKEIYVEDTPDNPNIVEVIEEEIINEYDMNEIDFLCRKLNLEAKTYNLNKLFLDEVFEKAISIGIPSFQVTLDRLASERDISLDVFLTSKDKNDFLNEMYKTATKQYVACLSKKINRELHLNRDLDDNELFKILENHLKYCSKDLSNYILGLDNIKSLYILQNYYSFKRINAILDFCNLHIDFVPETNKKKSSQSLPKVVAILNEIGFFDIPFIKNLSTDDDRYKVIAMLIREEYDSENFIREIRGNVYSLNENKSVNRDRYKAYIHKESVKKILNELK